MWGFFQRGAHFIEVCGQRWSSTQWAVQTDGPSIIKDLTLQALYYIHLYTHAPLNLSIWIIITGNIMPGVIVGGHSEFRLNSGKKYDLLNCYALAQVWLNTVWSFNYCINADFKHQIKKYIVNSLF